MKSIEQLTKLVKQKKNQEIILFVLILTLASLLRFYNLPYNMPFIGDQATEFISARDMALGKGVPLLGIHSSMPQFRQGPLYVWSLALIFKLFGYSPEITSYYAATLGVLSVGFLYILFRKVFGRRIAFFSAGILATSPIAVAHSQFSFIINPIPLFSVLYLFSLNSYIKNKKSNLFTPALLFGILFQFELASAPLIALLPIAYAYKHQNKKKFLKKEYKPFILGLILGLLPQILFDLGNNFKQLGLFSVWVGYRILSFFGIKGDHLVSPATLSGTTKIFIEFFHKFIAWDSFVVLTIFILTLLIGIYSWIRLTKKSKRPISIVFWWLVILIAAYYVHGSPAEAYFPALFAPFSIAFAWTMGNIQGRVPKQAVNMIIGLIMLLNTSFLLKTNILSTPIPAKNAPYGTTMWNPRLSTQKQLVEIIKKEIDSPINLKSIGSGSQFPSYLDNYRYLLWLSDIEIKDSVPTVWITRGKESKNPPFINVKSFPLEGTTVSIPIL